MNAESLARFASLDDRVTALEARVGHPVGLVPTEQKQRRRQQQQKKKKKKGSKSNHYATYIPSVKINTNILRAEMKCCLIIILKNKLSLDPPFFFPVPHNCSVTPLFSSQGKICP